MLSHHSQLKSQHGSIKIFWVVLLFIFVIGGLFFLYLRNLQHKAIREISAPPLSPPYLYPFQAFIQGKSRVPNLEKEIAFYQQRVAQDPKGGLNLALLATTYLRMGRLSGGISWYLLAEQAATRSLANLPFHNKGALLVLANVASFKHDFPQAIYYANQALKIQGTREEAFPILTTVYLALGDLNKAQKIADTLVNHIPNLETYALHALVDMAQSKDKETIHNFKKGLELEEVGDEVSSAWVRTMLGHFYFRRGRHKITQALYQESLRIVPQYPPAMVNLIELETRTKNFPLAEQHSLKLLEVASASPRTYDHLVMRSLARVKFLQGNLAEARKWWGNAETLLRKDINSFGHRRELARLLLERGDVKDIPEALLLARQERRYRHDAETLNVLAWAYSRSGQWHEAEAAMQQALHSGTREAEYSYRAGVIERALGNKKQARSLLRAALKVDPTFDKTARRGLGL